MKKLFAPLSLMLLFSVFAHAQPCAPQGDQVTYGTNNTWIGYVYDNSNFTNYVGYISEGSPSNPDFNEGFGGDNVNFPTNGCSFNTNSFSVRFRLRKTFTAGNYDFIVGGDDGYRLSLDGGVTWVINRWVDQAYTLSYYTAALNGTYDIVLEYYENGGQNRISFDLQSNCGTTGNPASYGSGNVWRGYVYDGTGFNTYKGFITRGTVSNPNFDENFGGQNVTFSTSDCSIQTETFSVRFRLKSTFVNQVGVFTIGGDDGYRFSIDGGATWLINRWNDQSYNVSTAVVTLNGNYDFVLEYYENGGDNRVSFALSTSLLSGIFANTTISGAGDRVKISWTTLQEKNVAHFELEQSGGNGQFTRLAALPTRAVDGNSTTPLNYELYTPAPAGRMLYRVVLVDKDGKKTYTPILSWTPRVSGADYSFFPTLVRSGQINLRTKAEPENLNLKVYDARGQLLGELSLRSPGGQATMAVKLPGTLLSHGIYRLQLTDAYGRVKTQTVLAE